MMVKVQKFVMMLVMGMMVVSPMVVSAQNTGLSKPVKPTGIKEQDFKTMLTTVINAILYIAGSLALLMIIVGGVMYITAGDSGRADTAKAYITYAIVGLIVCLIGLSIVNLVIGQLSDVK